MPDIADTVTLIAAAGVPVLFLDTCSILDVIRSPIPERKLVGCVEAATELLALAAANPPSCRLVVGSFVPGEWHKNAPVVRSELERRLNRMDEEAELFHSLCGHLAIPVAFGRPRYAASGFVSRLSDLSHLLLQSAVPLIAHPDTNGRAYERVAITQRRPCRKGGELKDCTIFEECLEVCQSLKATSFARKLIFCSSNTDDYCSPGVVPHDEVADDCSAAGLLFTTTLRWAISELKT